MDFDKFGILALLHVKDGKTNEAEKFLKSIVRLLENEPETKSCFIFRISPVIFGVFETFETVHGRDTHRCGKVVDAFFARTNDLFEPFPAGHDLDILDAKLPLPTESSESLPHASSSDAPPKRPASPHPIPATQSARPSDEDQ